MRAFSKAFFRSIGNSLGRFVAIAAIVALGTGFYAGLRMTAPNMDIAADAYYDGTALMDIRVVSTMGLDDADIEALRDIPDVQGVMPAYETDVMAQIGGESYSIRMHSLPQGASESTRDGDSSVSSDDPDYLNRLMLAEGRWPAAQGECVLSADRVMNTPLELGEKVVVTECSTGLDDTISTDVYEVVGFVHSPYYVSSTTLGTTSLGTGSIQQFMYVLDDNFDADFPYTEAFITVKGASDYLSGSPAYQERVDEVLAYIEEMAPAREEARLASLKEQAQNDLDEARSDFEAQKQDAQDKLAQAQGELDAAASDLQQGEAKVQDGKDAYASGSSQLAEQRAQAQTTLNDAQAELDDAQSQIDAQDQQLAQGKAQLQELTAQRSALQAQLDMLPADDPRRPTLLYQLNMLQGAIDELSQKLAQGEAQLAEAKAQLQAGRDKLQAESDEAQRQLAQAEAQLQSAAAEISSGEDELAQGRSSYEQGQAELAQERQRVDDELADAERKLDEAQQAIDEIEQPDWLIMDRTKNYGVQTFEADADRVDSIAQFFPFIFFLVAALVALTTMTRMVEEERVIIGTFKALGYSRARITGRYLAYAASASIIGAVIGIVALSLLLPVVIMEAYAIIYYVPHGMAVISVPLALLSAGLGIGVTLIATFAAVTATLREAPAALMLPRAPKAGKRILLERIGPLWAKFSFSWKVTCRNLFRYKKRFVMTVIGIAGCTALLLTGLGLHDSINDIIDKHFGTLVRYTAVVDFEEQDQAEAALEDARRIAPGATLVSNGSLVAQDASGKNHTVTYVSPEDPQAFEELRVLRERIGGEQVPLDSQSVIISEKLATIMGVQPGDSIELYEQDVMGNAVDPARSAVVTGVVENYIYNYVFLGSDAYESVFGEAPSQRAIYADVAEGEDIRAEFSELMNGYEGVKTIAFNDETIDTYRTMLRSVNMIVVVLVVAAAALAFIVLYNLTNINITERVREIATLKVLGFTRREVDIYVYRETILLSLIGCIIGLFLGVFLEGFVITTAEVDQVMFGREIHAVTFVYAFVLTLIFTMLSLLLMLPKLAHIDMVESLKSNE